MEQKKQEVIADNFWKFGWRCVIRNQRKTIGKKENVAFLCVVKSKFFVVFFKIKFLLSETIQLYKMSIVLSFFWLCCPFFPFAFKR